MIRVAEGGSVALACDACVVGSGAGGSAAAHALARGGRDVVLLEAGDHHDPASFDQVETTMMARLYHDAGQQTTVDQAMVVLTGAALGGSTVHNTALCVPPPNALLDRFAAGGALPAPRREFAAIVERVLRALGARPMRREDVNLSNRRLEDGARRLGLEVLEPLHNRERCDGCGYCVLGCAYNRKRHAVFAFLEDAVRAGLRIVTGARVTRLRREAGGGWRVSGPGFAVTARRVVLAAGALRTPCLLLSSGIGERRAIGRSLRLHPFAPVAAIFDDVVDAHRGIPQSTLVVGDGAFLEGRPGGYLFMASAAGPASTAAFVPGPAGSLRARMRAYRHLAPAGVLLHDEVPSRVGADRSGRPRIRAWPSGDDERRLRRGIAQLAELWFAAGARAVISPYTRLAPLTSAHDVAKLDRARFRPYDVTLVSVHPQASVPMGASARDPVRPDGALRGAPDLFVVDASVLPASIGVPPQVTIMSFAIAIVESAMAAGRL
jgi:choline dehydrogenase-like flavoprotein